MRDTEAKHMGYKLDSYPDTHITGETAQTPMSDSLD